MKIKNSNVLITGGASGIGRLMGRIAIEKGARSVIIWDINQDNIQKVSAEHRELAKGATAIYSFKVDVSDNERVREAYRQTVEAAGSVDILINNAGIVTSNRNFVDNTPEEIERTFRINSIAPMYVALAAMGDMVKADKGHVCNIASAAGMLGVPKMSAYVASKWACIGWSETLILEMKYAESNVKITTVAPYFINTGMFDGVQSKIFPILDPQKTAAKIIRGIEKDKKFLGIPFGFHFIRFCQFLLPRCIFDWFFGSVFGVYKVMDHFTGRKK